MVSWGAGTPKKTHLYYIKVLTDVSTVQIRTLIEYHMCSKLQMTNAELKLNCTILHREFYSQRCKKHNDYFVMKVKKKEKNQMPSVYRDFLLVEKVRFQVTSLLIPTASSENVNGVKWQFKRSIFESYWKYN